MKVLFLWKLLNNMEDTTDVISNNFKTIRIKEIKMAISDAMYAILRAENLIAECEETIECENIRIAKFRVELSKITRSLV